MAVPLDVMFDLTGNGRFRDEPKKVDTGGPAAPVVDMGCYESDAGVAMRLSEEEFEFTGYLDGANPAEQILEISSTGEYPLGWEIYEDIAWLTVEPISGITDGIAEVALRVDISGLAWGEYEGVLTVEDPGAINSPQTVAVRLRVVGPIIEVSQTVFDFVSSPEEPNTPDQILLIGNGGGSTLEWQIDESCDWLEVAPGLGSISQGGEQIPVTIKVDPNGLALGECFCELTVSDPSAENSPQIIEVNLYVTRNILVPEDYSSIQAAIDAANNRDVIWVADGIYVLEEHLSYKGKSIMVRSVNGPENCIIDGLSDTSRKGIVFNNGEDRLSQLMGFTIQNLYYRENPPTSTIVSSIYCGPGSSPMINDCI
ncbi:MAG: hypothetical protein GY869_06360, partial [Planctomycetes bacterium]|nr:hypothetical protein [Planctomycetota bacterium]